MPAKTVKLIPPALMVSSLGKVCRWKDWGGRSPGEDGPVYWRTSSLRKRLLCLKPNERNVTVTSEESDTCLSHFQSIQGSQTAQCDSSACRSNAGIKERTGFSMVHATVGNKPGISCKDSSDGQRVTGERELRIMFQRTHCKKHLLLKESQSQWGIWGEDSAPKPQDNKLTSNTYNAKLKPCQADLYSILYPLSSTHYSAEGAGNLHIHAWTCTLQAPNPWTESHCQWRKRQKDSEFRLLYWTGLFKPLNDWRTDYSVPENEK